jgi:hypothetical protein
MLTADRLRSCSTECEDNFVVDLRAGVMAKHAMHSDHRYIQLSVSPPCSDPLTLRKSLQDAFLPSFGISSSMYLDILWVSETGAEAVIRVHEACVQIDVA